MPKFALKDLLLSMTCITLAMGLLTFGLRSHSMYEVECPWVGLLIWLVLGVLIGAGLLAPFKRASFGAAWGLIGQIVLWMLLIAVGEA
jgi:hypothetical protein